MECSLPTVEGASIEVSFDAQGDIGTVSTRERPAIENGLSVLRPWGGAFSDYGELDGVRMPRRAEVWWDLPTGRFVYWRGEITSAHHCR